MAASRNHGSACLAEKFDQGVTVSAEALPKTSSIMAVQFPLSWPAQVALAGTIAQAILGNKSDPFPCRRPA